MWQFLFHVEKPTTYYQMTDEQLAAMLAEEKTPKPKYFLMLAKKEEILLWGKQNKSLAKVDK